MADALLGLTDNWIVIVLLINVVLLIAGMFIDAISAFYLFVPLFAPVLLELGMDMTTIGVMMTMNLALGLGHATGWDRPVRRRRNREPVLGGREGRVGRSWWWGAACSCS